MWAFGAGILFSVAATAGWVPRDAAAVWIVGPLLLIGGGSMWGLLETAGWIRRRLPSRDQRDRATAEASRLGLRSVERDVSALDRSIPFVRGPGRAYWAENFNRWFWGLFHPTFDWIFAGSWKGRDVRVFDYSLAKSDDREEWTCVDVALDHAAPAVHVARRSPLNRLARMFGRRDIELDDPEFDRAFQVRSEEEARARALLSAGLRGRILEKAPPFRFVMQTKDRRLLFCALRLPLEDRAALLDAASEVVDAFPRQI